MEEGGSKMKAILRVRGLVAGAVVSLGVGVGVRTEGEMMGVRGRVKDMVMDKWLKLIVRRVGYSSRVNRFRRSAREYEHLLRVMAQWMIQYEVKRPYYDD